MIISLLPLIDDGRYRQKDVDRRNLISLTGSPNDSAEKWASRKDQVIVVECKNYIFVNNTKMNYNFKNNNLLIISKFNENLT